MFFLREDRGGRRLRRDAAKYRDMWECQLPPAPRYLCVVTSRHRLKGTSASSMTIAAASDPNLPPPPNSENVPRPTGIRSSWHRLARREPSAATPVSFALSSASVSSLHFSSSGCSPSSSRMPHAFLALLSPTYASYKLEERLLLRSAGTGLALDYCHDIQVLGLCADPMPCPTGAHATCLFGTVCRHASRWHSSTDPSPVLLNPSL
ncbi:hypothetical protein B0H14DRAFT_3503737 [Mycena olivaceomarginata]|nr:hypothetical protein B0H14DRAFT_3503737 [Mycena olivaceomarginata]